MDDETIKLPFAPKKPYTRPQLHELGGSRADGKVVQIGSEASYFVGPS
jgi:hypothetical protein